MSTESDVTLTAAEREALYLAILGARQHTTGYYDEAMATKRVNREVERIVADRLAAEQERVWREGAAAGHHSPLTWFALRQVNPYSAARIARGDR